MSSSEPSESPVSMGVKEPSFNDLWTARTQAPTVMRLNWSNLYQTHPKEYAERVQEENRVRDLSGWRKKPRVEPSEHVGPPALNVRKRMKARMDELSLICLEMRCRERLQCQNAKLDEPEAKTSSPPKQKKKGKGARKRPGSGSAEAKRQTAAACEKNKQRALDKRRALGGILDKHNGELNPSGLVAGADGAR
jgi:hypothetical protein